MKKVVVVLSVIALLAVGLFVFNGMCKRTDVYVADYSVSDDGSVITINTGLYGSMGYIRSLKAQKQDDKVYVSFYQTFGFFNSSLGAKNLFLLSVDSACNEIYFDRGQDGFECILRRNDFTDNWQLVKK